MITSAILAPLILGTTVIMLGREFVMPSMVGAAALSMIPAACLGGLAMRYAASLPSRRALLTGAACGGVIFLGFAATIYMALFYARDSLTAEHVIFWVMASVGLTVIGCIVSAPMGFAFGLLFLVAFGPMKPRLQSPAQDTPAKAALASAVMLTIATAIAACAAARIGPSYTMFLETMFLEEILHITLAAWTRFLLFAGPLALSAIALALLGALEQRSLHRARSALLKGTHPEYTPGDIAPDVDAVPLSEADRKSANKRLLQRRDTSAYRGGEAHTASVYVGIS